MTAICSKCGRDCTTKLALGKHQMKGCEGPKVNVPDGWDPPISEDAEKPPKYLFYDRHTAKGEMCPKCCEIWEDFLILNGNTWVCLKCGCHFTPKETLNQVNDWKLKDATRRRNEPKDRVCGQVEAADEVAGVQEDPASSEVS